MREAAGEMARIDQRRGLVLWFGNGGIASRENPRRAPSNFQSKLRKRSRETRNLLPHGFT